MICGVVCNCGPLGEPMACGFEPGHNGEHSWAWIPTFRHNAVGITTRCTDCDAPFTDADLVGAVTCPKCGTKSLPCDVEQDTVIQINWHELRILTMWATNWASQFKESESYSKDTLDSIIRRLEKYRVGKRWPALTLLGEMMDLKADGCQLKACDANGNVLIDSTTKKGDA